MERQGVYIPSIDAKDLFIANNFFYDNPDGYNIKKQDGQYNLRKFINTFDYSLDLIKLREIYYKKYRRMDFGFFVHKKEYSYQVINVTFKYSNKEFNQTRSNVYVKFGYDYSKMEFKDCICLNDNGELVGIIVDEDVDYALSKDILGDYFMFVDGKYKCIKTPKRLQSAAELRQNLYKNGFNCNGIHYVRMKRSSGSARVGKCLFVNEDLYRMMHRYELGGIKVKKGQEIDLAALEAYISLPTSSIIDTIDIKPENFLIIDDYSSVFNEDVIATYIEDKHLKSSEKNVEINNAIWDGQSLIDISLLGEYGQYGMVLLRNLMFKSCCFNCNIQKWFEDNNITDISQLNGYTLATDIKDVKVITTPNSIKYIKFGTVDEWLNHISTEFGVVKHDKKTHYLEGRMVQTHYQLLNTLQLSLNDMKEFLKPSLDYATKLRTDPAVVKFHIKYPEDIKFGKKPMMDKNDVVFNLMSINNNFIKTKYYNDFLNDLLRSFYKNIKCGHVFVNGNYSTLCGNPIEMMQHAIGKFNGESQIGIGNVHSKRFEYGKTLLGSRSPHVTIGNILLTNNSENELIDTYCNFTEEIVAINSIGESILDRLSGCDFDSDTMLLTDNSILIDAARKNYDKFKAPVSLVSAKKQKRFYTPEQQADLDIKTSVNKIGEIINLSQILNSIYWNCIYKGCSFEEMQDLYNDISTLDIMSGIEIDKAKKEFEIDNTVELNKIRSKYSDLLRCEETGKKILPHFFSHISRQKGYYDSSKNNYCKHHTSMDYLQTVVNSFKVYGSRDYEYNELGNKVFVKKELLPFSSILNKDKFMSWHVNKNQITKIYAYIYEYISNEKKIFASDDDSQSKFERYMLNKEDLYDHINSENIGFSTMYQLLYSVESKKNTSIKNTLMEVLFSTNNKCFNKAIVESIEDMEYISGEGNDITLYEYNFKKLQKSATIGGI